MAPIREVVFNLTPLRPLDWRSGDKLGWLVEEVGCVYARIILALAGRGTIARGRQTITRSFRGTILTSTTCIKGGGSRDSGLIHRDEGSLKTFNGELLSI